MSALRNVDEYFNIIQITRTEEVTEFFYEHHSFCTLLFVYEVNTIIAHGLNWIKKYI